MKVYNYSQEGFLLSVEEADENPLEPGVFLIPAWATPKKPLTPKKDFNVIYNESSEKWEYVKIIPVIPDKPNEESVWNEELFEWVPDDALIELKRISDIKNKAYSIITSRYPLWKQINITSTGSVEEIKEMQDLISDIRLQSDLLELESEKTSEDFEI